jgi:hypothetical protein
MTLLDKEQLAAQATAVIQASFQRPAAADVIEILEMAKQQASALAGAQAPS